MFVAGSASQSTEQCLYVYRFGDDRRDVSYNSDNNCSPSATHLRTPTGGPPPTAHDARRRLTCSEGRRHRPGPGGGGGCSVVVGLYVAASFINCVSFLFTVLFGAVGLSITADLRQTVDAIDSYRVNNDVIALTLCAASVCKR